MITPRLPKGIRLYAIGDVHGRLDLLAALLSNIQRDNHARAGAETWVILLGDLIDRGPSSADVVAQCRMLAARHRRFLVLKGNHEAAMVEALNGNFPALGFWLHHGGAATLESWGVPSDLAGGEPSRDVMLAAKTHIPADDIAWLASRPLTFQRGNCLFVHAGIRPGIRLAKQAATDLLWIRGEFIDSTEALKHVVIHGHTVTEGGPELRNGRIGVDTGAYRTGRLTAVGIEGEAFWFISADTNALGLDADDHRASIAIDVESIFARQAERASWLVRSQLPSSGWIAVSVACAALLAVGTATLMNKEAPRRSDASSAAETRSERVRGKTFQPASEVVMTPGVRMSDGAGSDENGRPAIPPQAARRSFQTKPARTASLTATTPPKPPDEGLAPPVNATLPPAPVATAVQPSSPVARAASAPGSNNAPAGAQVELVLGPDRSPAVREGAVVVARPTNRGSAPHGTERERSRAIDAIRALRRQ